MVLKRKLPTQVAQEKESEDNKPKAEPEKKETQEGSEPWVFSGGENTENPKEEKKEPEPWSIESLDSGDKKEPKKDTPAKKAEPVAAASTGDYPWAISPSKESNEDGWKIEDETPAEAAVAQDSNAAKPPLAPTNDIYAGLGKDTEKSDDAGVPPWQKIGGGGDGKNPPIIPENKVSGGGSMIKTVIMLLVVVGVCVGGYMALFKNRDEVAEVTARWTGTLNEISQEIEGNNEDDPQPEDIISFNLGSSKSKTEKNAEIDKDTKKEVKEEPNKKIAVKKEPTTKVDFVDVDKEEAEEPITADEETEMPEELSLFASLQAAIMKEKEVKRTEDMATASEEDPKVDPETLSESEKVALGQKLRKKTNQEMDDYIKTLTKIKNPSLKPKPGSFFDNPEKYKKKADNYRLNKTSPKEEDFSYKSNPKNLPVIPEPVVPKKPGVRTLADFEDQIFEIPRDKVRMPRHLKPKVGAAGFPALEILSLVPHKGIIAFARGKEGILMIGEQIEGWELVSVRNEYAEFHNGKRKHVVSLDIIR